MRERHISLDGVPMPTYIDIDVAARRLNGRLASLPELATTLAEIAAQPARYHCLLRNDYTGKYRYADTQSDSAGDSAGHPQ